MIPLANPRANYLAHQREIDNAIIEVLGSGTYIGGQVVEDFEKEFAAFIGAKHAIGVNSGTDALTIALRSLYPDVPEVVSVPANTALATVAAVLNAGLGVDLVGGKDPAYVSVHLHGLASVSSLTAIEDCAQACGGRYNGQRLGTFGKLGCFSFYPTKNLGALGDGGMIVTSDDKLAERCRQIREYGWGNKYRIPACLGINSRLDPVQAAVLRVKLKYLDDENERRWQIAVLYEDGLKDIVKTPSLFDHCFHLYVIECGIRDDLAEYLGRNGIGVGIHYRRPIHCEAVYREFVKITPSVAEAAEEYADSILSLPMYPELTDKEVESVIGCIRSFYTEL